jgi:alcohol dehydrogenase class IV
MNEPAIPITMHLPRTLAFGAGCLAQCAAEVARHQRRRVFVVRSPSTRVLGEPLYAGLRELGCEVHVWDGIAHEPAVADFHHALIAAREVSADAVIGLGGGSAMDVAKLVAALLRGEQDVRETFGIGKLLGRSTFLACLPTTAGTGSEVSPNAILLDEQEQLKKGVISPHLMPDAAYIDPDLTRGVPPAITAATGMDALTHCIEAYANRFAHPMIDVYALQGIRLISKHLPRAVEHGQDLEARTHVAMGSMYGGFCLGPVNTGAVHALAYPLGGEFHVAHGVSNAVLLPHVLEFNLSSAPQRYATIAVAMGAQPAGSETETAQRGLEIVRELSRRCGIPAQLRELGVPKNAIERMARSAMTVTRLLERNVRTVTQQDAIDIYTKAY